ncbi:MAG: glycosyltransferase, partial [Candidatus Asgardarchaeia archaeon]
MLFELYYAIKKYHPEHKQIVIYTTERYYNSLFVSTSAVPCVRMKDERKIVNTIAEYKNAVVLYHKLANSSVNLVRQIKKGTKAKVIAINHTLFKTTSWGRLRELDLMIGVSDNMNRQLGKWYPHLKHCFIYNGVNQERYEPITPRGMNKKGALLTGRINRVCSWKHSDGWLKWCAEVDLPCRLIHHYIGDKVSGHRRSRNMTKRGKNEVQMLGGVNDFKTKVAMMKDWDIFLYETNRDEGISMAILEAMACGIPVVCSDNYGNKEIIKHGVNGYIFSDRKRAKKILSNLIKNPDKLERLKISTKEYFKEQLDAKYMARGYISVINKLCGIKDDYAPVKIIDEKPSIASVKTKRDNDKFSILTSSFNKVPYLMDWHHSILKQKYRPLEVVFADDCSNDGTSQLIKTMQEDFSKNDIEFKLVKSPQRLYCGASYHNLFNSATGSFFGVVDADDALVDDSVEFIMKLYNKYPDVAWIYTQFQICDMKMNKKRKGFCSAPSGSDCLLDIGKKRVHGFGHWRTFNYKIEKPRKLFNRKLKCGVDKFMGYRLEEFGPGMFVNRVCYKYRQHPVGSPNSVSSTKEAIKVWHSIMDEATHR